MLGLVDLHGTVARLGHADARVGAVPILLLELDASFDRPIVVGQIKHGPLLPDFGDLANEVGLSSLLQGLDPHPRLELARLLQGLDASPLLPHEAVGRAEAELLLVLLGPLVALMVQGRSGVGIAAEVPRPAGDELGIVRVDDGPGLDVHLRRDRTGLAGLGHLPCLLPVRVGLGLVRRGR